MIYVGAVVLGGAILVVIFSMLLRRSLREKYAVFWLLIGVIILIVGVVPSALTWATHSLGFELPANLIFTLTLVLLLGVALHLSAELTRQEDKVRRLAEEAAITRLRILEIEKQLADGSAEDGLPEA
jgi:hypothetical protein